MSPLELTLRYGRRGLRVSLPDANVRHVLRYAPAAPLDDPRAATARALAQPLGAPPLRELARGRRRVCLVTSDITRPVPNAVVLPPILDALEAAGVPLGRVTILIGTGSHRPNTEAELRDMLGPEVIDRGVSVVNHDAFDPAGLVARGQTRRGTPVSVSREYAESDLRLSAALVEPHLIAGFSGGRKAICPGIAGIETILRFHAPELVQPDAARAGLLDGNPAHEESFEAASLAGAPGLTVNVTLDEERRVTGVFAGEMDQAHRAAVRHSLAQSRVAIPAAVDIAVTTAAGHPLDLTFYQSVKGLAAPVGILNPGGTIVAAHECAEGIGEPDLVRAMMDTTDLETYVPRVFDPAWFHMDQWVAQFTKIRRRATEVMCYSSGVPTEQLARCFVTPISSVEDGVRRALDRHGPGATIAVIPEGPYVLPCLA